MILDGEPSSVVLPMLLPSLEKSISAEQVITDLIWSRRDLDLWHFFTSKSNQFIVAHGCILYKFGEIHASGW